MTKYEDSFSLLSFLFFLNSRIGKGKLQKSFICKYLGVRITTPYSMLLMDSGCLSTEYYGLICMLRYIQKVRNMHKDRLPRQAWETCKRPKKNYKSNLKMDVRHQKMVCQMEHGVMLGERRRGGLEGGGESFQSLTMGKMGSEHKKTNLNTIARISCITTRMPSLMRKGQRKLI